MGMKRPTEASSTGTLGHPGRPLTRSPWLARFALAAVTVAVLAAACSNVAEPMVAPSPTLVSTPVPTPTPELVLLDDNLTNFLRVIAPSWTTDFSIHTVPYAEIKPGGTARDGIPPIADPIFAPVADAPDYLVDAEPVIVLELNGEQRAYPLSILIAHEVVNDVIGGEPVAVTYCPLCNTGLVFRRTVNGDVLRFGTSGLLRNSNLIMWDRTTESWWQQVTGEAIVGTMTGTRLDFIPAQFIDWAAFRDSFPEGVVLVRDPDSDRAYDLPPYGGRDASAETRPTFADGSLSPVERVVSLVVNGSSVAYPFAVLEATPIVHDTFQGQALVIFYVGGTLSPFAKRPIFSSDSISSVLGSGDQAEVDPSTIEKRAVGSTAVFEPFADGLKLSFVDRDGVITDRETGSTWNIFGEAVTGELEGTRLAPVLHGNHFWFAQEAFFPDTTLRILEDLEGPPTGS